MPAKGKKNQERQDAAVTYDIYNTIEEAADELKEELVGQDAESKKKARTEFSQKCKNILDIAKRNTKLWQKRKVSKATSIQDIIRDILLSDKLDLALEFEELIGEYDLIKKAGLPKESEYDVEDMNYMWYVDSITNATPAGTELLHQAEMLKKEAEEYSAWKDDLDDRIKGMGHLMRLDIIDHLRENGYQVPDEPKQKKDEKKKEEKPKKPVIKF